MLSDLLSTIASFEKRGDIQGGIEFLFSKKLPLNDLNFIAKILISEQRYLFAFALADRLISSGWDTITLRLTRGIVANIAGRKDQYENDRTYLEAQPPLSNEERESLWTPDWLLGPLNHMFQLGNNDSVFQIGALLKSVEPRLNPIYESKRLLEWEAASNTLPYIAKTIFEAKPVPRRNVIVACRERFFPSIKNSRYHEIGPRLVSGLIKGGWNATFFPLSFSQAEKDLIKDYRRLEEYSDEVEAELIIIDQPRLLQTEGHVLFQNRPRNRSRKLIGLYLDPWAKEHWPEMRAINQFLDLTWSAFAAAPIWDEPIFATKKFFSPLPYGIKTAKSDTEVATIQFTGGVGFYNWQRALWLSAMKSHGLPIDIHLSNHLDDGLSAIKSSNQYFLRLKKSGAAINFSMRSNFSRTQTGRTFEIIASGALLIQEESKDVNLYFIPGKHFFPFRSLGDLKEICLILRTKPEMAKKVRNAGLSFYNKHYSDTRIVSLLDQTLFK